MKNQFTSLRVARLISDFTSPPVIAIPTLTVLCLYDQARVGGTGWDLLARLFLSITFGITLPTVYIIFLFRRNRVTDLHISVREQRTLPYLVSIGFYLLGFVLIYLFIGPGVLAAAMLVNVIIGISMALINLKWKISAHAIGIANPLALLTLLFGPVILPLYLLIPLISWARVKVKAHTLAQVVAGTLLGFILTLLQFALIYYPLGWV